MNQGSTTKKSVKLVLHRVQLLSLFNNCNLNAVYLKTFCLECLLLSNTHSSKYEIQISSPGEISLVAINCNIELLYGKVILAFGSQLWLTHLCLAYKPDPSLFKNIIPTSEMV